MEFIKNLLEQQPLMALFVALAIGWFAPKSAPSPIGIQYGKQFFIGLSSMQGLKANIMALTGVLLSGVVSVLFIRYVTAGHALGLFASRPTVVGHRLGDLDLPGGTGSLVVLLL